MKTAVMISNMGGPDSLEAVERYLANVFRDPAIIDVPMPRFLRARFARWLAGKRAPKSIKIYERLGGSTPLTGITARQAALLEASLNGVREGEFRVYPAMRYWHPLVEDVWREIVSQRYGKLVVVSLFPYHSYTTTGSLVRLVKRLNAGGDFPGDDLVIVDRFGEHPAYVKAVAAGITGALRSDGDSAGKQVDLILSAHSVPLRSIRKGDPYKEEIETSAEAIKSLLPRNVRVHLSYQSKIGPVKWLGPFTSDKIGELAARGTDRLYVYPLGHVADNSETLYEIEILLRKIAHDAGIESYHRIDALNTDPLFINALRRIIMEKLRES